MPDENEDWRSYQKLVLSELKRLNKHDGEIYERLGKIDVKIGQLEVRAGLWGALAGAVPAIGAILFWLLTK